MFQLYLLILLVNMFCYMVPVLSTYSRYTETLRDTLACFTDKQSVLGISFFVNGNC